MNAKPRPAPRQLCAAATVTTISTPSRIASAKLAALAVLTASALALAGEPSEEARIRLSTAEIAALFAGVKDSAVVQEFSGSSAVTYWHADGRFETHWRNGTRTGRVSGRWFARDDQRCAVYSGPDDAQTPITECAAIYRQGGRYLSVKPDGTIHGIHILSPLP